MRNAENGGAGLEAGGDLDREVLVWLSEVAAIADKLRIECACIKNASETFDGAFTWVLSAMVKRNGNADVDISGQCILGFS